MSFAVLAVFLDRDGTVIADRHHLADPAGVELLPNAAAGLHELRRLGAKLVLVTNQSGVGRGYFTATDVARVHERLRELLADEGLWLDGVYVCPHAPADSCDCRKPETGLFLAAAADLGLSLERSFVVGDRDADVEAGRRIGATPIRIAPDSSGGELRAPDLLGAARIVRSRLPSARR